MSELLYYDLKEVAGLAPSLSSQVAREIGRRIVSGSYAPGELIEDEAHATIRLLDAERKGDTIVGAYLADAKAGPQGPEPVHFRESFRARGPSNYNHGKQANSQPIAAE